MKSEPKAFASLSSGLLARKGAARPAMRPQGFGQGSGLEDLGWNDMGFEPPKPALTPVRDANHDAFGDAIGAAPLRNPAGGLTPVTPVSPAPSAPPVSPVHVAHAEIAERLNGPEPIQEAAQAPSSVPDTVEEVAEEVVAEVVAEVAKSPPRTASVPRRSTQARAEAGAKSKAAFTLRLDPERHLKLRLACAISARSAQQLVTRAVDELLASMPELDLMAERAPERASNKG